MRWGTVGLRCAIDVLAVVLAVPVLLSAMAAQLPAVVKHL